MGCGGGAPSSQEGELIPVQLAESLARRSVKYGALWVREVRTCVESRSPSPRGVDSNSAAVTGKSQPERDEEDSRTVQDLERETGQALFVWRNSWLNVTSRKGFIVEHEGMHRPQWTIASRVKKRLREYWEAEGKTAAGKKIADFQQTLCDSQTYVDRCKMSHYAVGLTFSLIWEVDIDEATYICATIVFANRETRRCEDEAVRLVGGRAFWCKLVGARA